MNYVVEMGANLHENHFKYSGNTKVIDSICEIALSILLMGKNYEVRR
jgi:hypothetical protein